MGAVDYAVPLLVSLAPGLAALLRVAGRSSRAWLVAAAGGGGWLAALALRVPMLMYVQALEPARAFAVSSALAGVFEEAARSVILRVGLVREEGARGSLSLGLGWGLSEALLVYALPVVVMASAGGHGLLELLPGALERNSALLVHLSLTMLLARDPRSLRLLLASVVLHSAINLAAGVALLSLRNVWLAELVVAALALTLFAATAPPTLRALGGGDGKGTAEQRAGLKLTKVDPGRTVTIAGEGRPHLARRGPTKEPPSQNQREPEEDRSRNHD